MEQAKPASPRSKLHEVWQQYSRGELSWNECYDRMVRTFDVFKPPASPQSNVKEKK